MCKYCDTKIGKTSKLTKGDEAEPHDNFECNIFHSDEESPGILLWNNGFYCGYFDIKYCPMCGRKLDYIIK